MGYYEYEAADYNEALDRDYELLRARLAATNSPERRASGLTPAEFVAEQYGLTKQEVIDASIRARRQLEEEDA